MDFHNVVKEELSSIREEIRRYRHLADELNISAGTVFRELYSGPRTHVTARKRKDHIEYVTNSFYNYEKIEYVDEWGEVRVGLSWRRSTDTPRLNDDWSEEELREKDRALNMKEEMRKSEIEEKSWHSYGSKIMNEYRTECVEQMFEYY